HARQIAADLRASIDDAGPALGVKVVGGVEADLALAVKALDGEQGQEQRPFDLVQGHFVGEHVAVQRLVHEIGSQENMVPYPLTTGWPREMTEWITDNLKVLRPRSVAAGGAALC